MVPTPCPYATRWPELFARLPDDTARESLSQALANARLEGWDPAREYVELLVDGAVGEMGSDELIARTVALARRPAATPGATPG